METLATVKLYQGPLIQQFAKLLRQNCAEDMAQSILCSISFLETIIKEREREREIFHCINNKIVKIAKRDFIILWRVIFFHKLINL